MPPFTDADIERIGLGVEDRSLPKPEWTHAAHWAAALWVISRHGPDAETRMPGLIRAYNEATGVANTDTGGYHHTITLASMRAARAHIDAVPDKPLSAILATLLASDLGRPDWILAHWSRAHLFTRAARLAWLDPDLQPLPW